MTPSENQATESKTDTSPRWHSELTGPISELTFLQRSLLFAELSSLSYEHEQNALTAAATMGLPHVQYFDRSGAQAYRFENDHDCVVVCRGTEPHEWNDIQADCNAISAVAETVGRVHSGFKTEVDDLWPMLEESLRRSEKPLWFTGHSLGGAMATICAGRCKISDIPCEPTALFSYGSPRVGDRRYVNFVRLVHYRWVNNNDIVCRVPPRWMGYRHAGTEVYLDAHGRLRRAKGWLRLQDRARGLWTSLLRGKIDYFSDHSMLLYISAIKDLVDKSDEPRIARMVARLTRAEHDATLPQGLP